MFKSRLILLLRTVQLRKLSSSFYSPEFIFNEENIKRTVSKFQSLKPLRMITHEPSKRAGVLIPLCIANDKVALLYTLRSANLKTHRGQVSFPGGMQDINDRSLEETALRETREELGIEESNIEIWGSGQSIVTRYETSVTPVIGRIKGHLINDQLTVNRNEVEDVFTICLEDLCKPKNIGYTQFRGGFISIPVYVGGKFRVWGLTALMTYRLLTCLLPQRAYFHNIKYYKPIKSNMKYSKH